MSSNVVFMCCIRQNRQYFAIECVKIWQLKTFWVRIFAQITLLSYTCFRKQVKMRVFSRYSARKWIRTFCCLRQNRPTSRWNLSKFDNLKHFGWGFFHGYVSENKLKCVFCWDIQLENELKLLTMCSCGCQSAVSPMRGSPVSDNAKKNRKGEFITPPRPTGMRINCYSSGDEAVMTTKGEKLRMMMIQIYVVVFLCFSLQIAIHAGNLPIKLQNYIVFHCTYI